MKIRTGFVSNSSSSSFVVNGSTIFMVPGMPKNLVNPEVLVVPHLFGGEIEFGRQRENYKDFGSRLNWAFMQARYIERAWEFHMQGDMHYAKDWFTNKRISWMEKHQDDIEMLEEVLVKELKIDRVLWRLEIEKEFDKIEDYQGYNPDEQIPMSYGHIDHQSVCYDSDHGMEQYDEIFKNKESLSQWLFGKDNYVACRSDEYEDADELEVNHMFDYEYYDLYKHEA